MFSADSLIPLLLAFIAGYGILKRKNIFSLFIEGAAEGLKTCAEFAPAIVLMVTLVGMLRSSGAVEVLSSLLLVPCKLLGIPSEILPLTVMHPLSGAGSLAIFGDILATFGPDSKIGQIASVMQGSAETTFYTIMVYYGATRIKNQRHTLAASLTADFTGLLASVATVSLLL